MKRLFIAITLSLMMICAIAQTSSKVPPRYDVNPNARYQLFPTENLWIFINLDTQTGKMWMVQYSIDDPKDRGIFRLNDLSLILNESDASIGRFTLYPTRNMFTFILLDQIDGRTWQVQWSTKSEERGIWKIR